MTQRFRFDTPSPHLARPPPDTSRNEYDRAQAETAWRHAEQAQDRATARAWLERAARFAPSDQNLAFALATARLGDGDAAGALSLFSSMAANHAVREVFAGQAASALALGQPHAAAGFIAQALAGFAMDSAVRSLAEAVAIPWCGITDAGRVQHAPADRIRVWLDGRRVKLSADGALPPAWRRARKLTVEMDGVAPLGSPINLAALHRCEGMIARFSFLPGHGGVTGWAWHPAAPEADPVLMVTHGGATWPLIASDRSVDVSGAAPLTRPRGFSIPVPAGGDVRVTGPDGRDLLGSPLLSLRQPSAAPPPCGTRAVTVVIPVYSGEAVTLACVRSVLATLGPQDRVIVVNDASPEPALVAGLQALARQGAIALMPSCAADPARNLGFPGAANAGLHHAAGTDVVLLNSDTLVFSGWLAALRGAAHAFPDIGTATPLSNNATIFTYPDPANPSPMPLPAQAAELASQAASANAGILVEVPTGHGFCLYIRADCLHATGLLRQDVFGQGYGEENDFCERARAGGWRHVAVPSVYVAHRSGESFGAARGHLLRRNAALLHDLHPEYHARVAAFLAEDGLAAARRRLDAVRWRAAHEHAAPARLLITHGGAGGTQRVVKARAAACRARGETPITLTAQDGMAVLDAADSTPNLRFALPAELGALAALLAASRPQAAELHHLLGHDSSITTLLAGLRLPYELWVHDWSWLCPRLSLITPEERFCGEPPLRDCAACESRGEPPAMGLTAARLRARSAALLQGATAIVVATRDAATRLARHFPGISTTIRDWATFVGPLPPHGAAPHQAQVRRPGATLTVAVAGAIGVEKGYGVLLACARDAASRGLNLDFAVIGYTVDDPPLLETGRVRITGPFAAEEAQRLIAASQAQLGFLPSIWPETWCYALTDLWQAGLDVAVFDIGAPAERVRQSGGGYLLPLGLPPAAVNDALLRLHDLASRSAP